MQDDEKTIKEVRAESSQLFWDRKARFTYYLLSLPFALTAVAVSSFKGNSDVPVIVLFVEVASWLLFLLSGFFGLLAKWGEMESARMESVMAGSKLAAKREILDKGQALTEDAHRVWRNNSDRLIRAERAESIGSKWIIRLLAVGCVLWVAGRSWALLSPALSAVN